MKNSLLAHLYPYIKGSQEDIATFSLQYLLSQSNKLNEAFTKLVADKMKIELENSLRYFCQVTGDSEEQERPDMVGVDSDGKEAVLFEMKFYASLTANQPNTYLKRLRDNNGKGLLFVCPESRRTSLWATLKDVCEGPDKKDIDKYCIVADGVKLAIATWSEIIDMLKQVASSVDNAFTSDILQLEGYCNRIDSDAFIPFSAEDLSARTAIKEERYYEVINELIDLFIADKSRKCTKVGKANAYRNGYSAKILLDNYKLEVLYDRRMWRNPATMETPFWVAISNSENGQTDDVVRWINTLDERHRDSNEYTWTYVALGVLQNATLSEVCENLKRQILKYVDEIR